MQIGRILALTEPHDWQASDDDSVTMTADYQSTAVADGLFVREQLLSYPAPDELAIPIVLTSEPRSSGFYRPVRTQILTGQMERIHGHIFNYTMELQRVADFTSPFVESVINGARMTNAVGAVDTDVFGWFAYPGAGFEFQNTRYSLSGGLGQLFTRSTADGNVGFVVYAQGAANIPSLARYSIAPSSFYLGAARIEMGASLKPIVGRNLTQQDLVNWRVQNGVVRVVPNAAADGSLDISHWNGAAWTTAKRYSVFDASSSATTAGLSSITVLRNSAEESIVRLGLIGPGLVNWVKGTVVNLDISIRRGDRTVRFYLTSNTSTQWGMARVGGVEAATAIAYGAVTTGAMRATANDAGGNRFILGSYQNALLGFDLANDIVYSNANVLATDLFVGLELGGSTAVFPDTAVAQAQMYLAAMSEEQRIVAR